MRNIPTITKNLLIINVLMFIATFVFKRVGIDLTDMLGLHFFMASDFHYYQLITYMFMHGGLEHIFFNMFALWMFGMVVERVWGPKRFIFYYISCGIGAGIIQEIAQFVSFSVQDLSAYQYILLDGVGRIPLGEYLNYWTTVGASGAIYGVLLAFGLLFPNERIFLFPLPIPIKALWFVMGYAAIELFSGLSSQGDNVAHFAHLGGMLVGFIMFKYWQHHNNGGGYFNNYGRSSGKQFFEGMKRNWEKHKNNKSDTTDNTRNESDWDYNAHKKSEQEEIDRILDKIRRSGYDSLTKEEKKKLFDNSNK